MCVLCKIMMTPALAQQVRSVVWSTDDSRLVSCGMDGAVYEWNALSGQRESESVLKSCSYTGVALSLDTRSILAVGNDCTLKEIQDCQASPENCLLFFFFFKALEQRGETTIYVVAIYIINNYLII